MFSVPIFIPLTEQFVSILFTVRQFRANIINLRPRTNSFDLFVYPIVSHLESYPQVIHHGQVACNIRIQCQGTTVGSKIELNLNTTVFVEYSSKCRRKLLKILARIQSSPRNFECGSEYFQIVFYRRFKDLRSLYFRATCEEWRRNLMVTTSDPLLYSPRA